MSSMSKMSLPFFDEKNPENSRNPEDNIQKKLGDSPSFFFDSKCIAVGFTVSPLGLRGDQSS